MTATTTSKILYADDDLDDRFFFEETLAATGMAAALVYAANGEEAITYLESAKQTDALPALIVLDLNMPRKNGTETLSYIKSHPRFAKIPVVMLSTSATKKDKDTCAHLGAASFFKKPNRYTDYVQLIKSFQPFMEPAC